ncbi:MAG TPA: aminopeptidase P family protein [Actinomycetales bacterium]|nr:aminopeptidase P family protein [Actinomycetales bacterium]
MSEQQPKKSDHRSRPTSEAFKKFIAEGWAPRPTELPPRAEVAPYAASRRASVSAHYPGERVVVPAGGLKVRSNDTDYVFRPHSAFSYLTGLGADREPDAVLVLEPRDGGGHEAVLYFRPRAGRDTEEFYADARYGELWVGVRPSLQEVEAELEIVCRHIDELKDAISKDVGSLDLRVLRDADPEVTAMVDEARSQVEGNDHSAAEERDEDLAVTLSELRLVKDEWETEQMRLACAATAEGFAAIARSLPDAVAKGRGERWVEGQFGLVARHVGNGVGYDSIAASGDHACTLHWIRNDGEVRDGDLLLVDAGVEVDSLYTADVTRTMPVNGRFSEAQRRVYQAVLDAQEAGMAAVKPGNKFKDVHAAAIRVIAERLHEWGLLPVDVETTLGDEGGYHRRWMVHGTSHHLGIDVHDCAQARREEYMEGELRPGMVITVEPGLYFKADDVSIPEELRGIGVRIEDDVLVTDDGFENLSAALPRTPDDVEAWLAELRP